MQRLYIGLLGGAIGLLSSYVIYVYNSSEFYTLAWLLPGALSGLALIWLRGETNWWRRTFALLLCASGYPLAFFAGLVAAMLFMAMGLGSTASDAVPLVMLALAGVGAAGGVLVALTWSVLYERWSAQVFRQGLWVGTLLAQVGIVTLPFLTFSSPSLLLPVWCAGMLILADFWSRSVNPQPSVQARA